MNDGKQSNYWSPEDSSSDDSSSAPSNYDGSAPESSLHPSLTQLVNPNLSKNTQDGLTKTSKNPTNETSENSESVSSAGISPAKEASQPLLTPISWVAPEYYAGTKNKTWYLIFGIVVIALMAVSIFILHSWSFAILIAVMAVSLVVYSHRPATEIKYTLSVKQGLYVGDRLYNLQDFKAFSLVREGGHNSIMLIPVKRFAPGVSVYFPTEMGEEIIDILASRLPMEESKPDFMDKIVSKLKI